jgi:hypothetical protein
MWHFPSGKVVLVTEPAAAVSRSYSVQTLPSLEQGKLGGVATFKNRELDLENECAKPEQLLNS